MADPGTAPVKPRHFKTEVTEAKLLDYLDTIREFDIELVKLTYLGGRHWHIVTYGAPVPGPAGRRIFQ